ncbi:MAG: hypothetical protein NC110_06640 [Ruminococcus sp.]|nr:hypothetical protein [Ruminococcus sp.]
MGVKVKTVKNELPNMMKEFKALDGRKVKVGVTGEHAWLAGIHEFGCVIKPHKQYLTIPCSPKSFGKRASDFSDLWVYEAKSGEKFLARDVTKKRFECLFWLTKSVNIPERSFLRSGFDENKQDAVKQGLLVLGYDNFSAENALKIIGESLRDSVKKYARDLKEPPKSSMTVVANKGKTNPLVQTGDMIEGIISEVE